MRTKTHPLTKGMRNRWDEAGKGQMRKGAETFWKEGKTHRGRN